MFTLHFKLKFYVYMCVYVCVYVCVCVYCRPYYNYDQIAYHIHSLVMIANGIQLPSGLNEASARAQLNTAGVTLEKIDDLLYKDRSTYQPELRALFETPIITLRSLQASHEMEMDMEIWRYGDMETWTRRYGDMETWTWRYGDMEIWRWRWKRG